MFYYNFSLFLHRIKVFKVVSTTKNEKGTSVKIRDYTRSCKFHKTSCILNGHCLYGGKATRRKQVRRPAFFSFEMLSGDRASKIKSIHIRFHLYFPVSIISCN